MFFLFFFLWNIIIFKILSRKINIFFWNTCRMSGHIYLLEHYLIIIFILQKIFTWLDWIFFKGMFIWKKRCISESARGIRFYFTNSQKWKYNLLFSCSWLTHSLSSLFLFVYFEIALTVLFNNIISFPLELYICHKILICEVLIMLCVKKNINYNKNKW